MTAGAARRLRKDLLAALQALQSALRTQAIVDVFPLAEGFVTEYAEERRARGTADYDDLLLWTRELLATSPEACAYARRRFRAILVDEFQDTDPVQAEIAVRLASDDPSDTDWLAMRPREGSLTVVGDPEAVDLSLPPRRHRCLRRREERAVDGR